MIAETARMRADLSSVTATDELVVELRTLAIHREDLMADWVREFNRLRDLLSGTFPTRERSFDYSTRSALILLTGFQTPESIARTVSPPICTSTAPGPRASQRWPRRRWPQPGLKPCACPMRPPQRC